MSRLTHRARQAVRHPFKLARRPVRAARTAVGEVATGGGHDGHPGIEVWQWTGRKYRVRAIVLILVNMALFVGLGCFTFWLRTGNYSPFGVDNYWETWRNAFSPSRDSAVTLINFLIYPIPVDQAPLMLIIVGLVLASLTAIPILVSMLYRFPYAVPFTLIICFVAVVPWLAITVTLSCFLARWRPLRFSFPYATALIAMLPLVAYYAMATRGPALASHVSGPLEMAKLYLPWVLALIGACVVMAIVLIVARVVKYRPGAIAPTMTVLFAVPVALFETQVGRDELYYRLLEVNYGPQSTEHFVDYADASRTIDRIAAERAEALRNSGVDADELAIREQIRLLVEFGWSSLAAELNDQDARAEEEFTQAQLQAVLDCNAFLDHYPQSRYVPGVLFIKARALDMRLDRAFFRRTAIIRHYWDFPSEASLPAWQAILQRREPPLWALAAHRVALLDARRGDQPAGPARTRMDVAVEVLDDLLNNAAQAAANPSNRSGPWSWRSFFAKRSAAQSLDVDPAAVLLEARKLYSLIVNNRDPQQNDRPLVELLRLNPRHPMYPNNLRELRAVLPQRYPMTPLRDNLDVLIASASAGPSRSRRIELLQQCVESCSREAGSDALPQARFELGMAYKDDSRIEDARRVFEELSRGDPRLAWVIEARRQLAEMGVGRIAPATEPSSRPVEPAGEPDQTSSLDEKAA